MSVPGIEWTQNSSQLRRIHTAGSTGPIASTPECKLDNVWEES